MTVPLGFHGDESHRDIVLRQEHTGNREPQCASIKPNRKRQAGSSSQNMSIALLQADIYFAEKQTKEASHNQFCCRNIRSDSPWFERAQDAEPQGADKSIECSPVPRFLPACPSIGNPPFSFLRHSNCSARGFPGLTAVSETFAAVGAAFASLLTDEAAAKCGKTKPCQYLSPNFDGCYLPSAQASTILLLSDNHLFCANVNV
jgi:hypothetical protein